MIKEILSSVWFTFCLNVALCAAVFFIGYFQTKKLNKKSKENSSYQLRAYVPTIWTSLGILGTFISILFSLIVWAISGEDNINRLIYNIAPAFTTSIIGIIGSIITSIKNKQYLASVECNEEKAFKRHQYENNISSSGTSFSPEVILLEILKEIKNSRKKTTEENEELIKSLNGLSEERDNKINAFQEALERKLNDILTRIRTESESTRNKFSEALEIQKNDFKDAIEEIKKTFDGSLSRQNENLNTGLTRLDSTLGTKIDIMTSKLDGSISQLIGLVKESLAAESEKRNNELRGFIKEENDRMAAFIDEQSRQYKTIDDNLTATIADIRQLFETDVKQAIERFAEEQHKVSIETLAQWNSKLVSDAENCLNNHSEEMQKNLHELDEKTKETYNSFRNTIIEIAQTVATKLQELYDCQTGLIGDTINSNRNQLETSLSENRNSIQTILNANEESIRRVSDEIKADNEDIKQELTKAQSEWKKEAVRIEGEHLDEVKRIHTDAEKDIQEIHTKITKYESAIQQSLGDIKEELIKSVSEFKTSINNIEQFIVDNNKGLQEDLRKQIHDAFHINELEVSCQKLKDGIDSTINSLTKCTNGIDVSLSSINESLEGSSKKYIDTVVNSNDLLTYINETLNVSRQNITSVVAILGQIDTLNKATKQIEEDIMRIQTLQSSENEKTKRNKRQEQ